MDSPKAYLGSVPLLGSSPVRWQLKSGVRPVTQTFDVTPQDADTLRATALNSRSPVTLTMTTENGQIIVKNLWILNIYPGENKYIRRVTVADRRWMWSYAWVKRAYNIRRHIATRRALSSPTVGEQPAIDPVVFKWQYGAYSLKGTVDQGESAKWKGRDLIKDILGVLSKYEKSYWGGGFEVKFDPSLSRSTLEDLPIEDVMIDDAGDSAAMRALSYFPETTLYIDLEGNPVLYYEASGLEGTILRTLGSEIVGEGHAEYVDNSLVRPSAIEIYFTREVELRFDFNEVAQATVGAGQTGADPVDADMADNMVMENVIPIPDYQLPPLIDNGDGTYTNPGGDPKDTVAQGTYITMNEYFRKCGVLPNPFGGAMRKLDHDLVQKAFMPYTDLWNIIGANGQYDPANDWIPRLSAVQNHYRKTFRINPRWRDRIFVMRPYRVAVIDQVSGQRSPSLAFADHALLYTQRSQWKDYEGFPGPTACDYAKNRTAFAPSNTARVIGPGTIPAPAEVSIPDSDQGIIHIDYILDPNRLHEQILPSLIVNESMPRGIWNSDARQNHPVSYNSMTSLSSTSIGRLSPSFQCSLIVTAIPAAPNSLSQLHKVTIKPGDIAKLLPSDLTAGLSSANGPILQIHIGPGVETAKIRWDDSAKARIEQLFGIQSGKQIPPNTDGTELPQPNVDDLVINEKDSDIPGGASLTAIAKAEAARLYATYVNRILLSQNTISGNVNGAVQPGGWADTVTHELRTTGAFVTKVEIRDKIEPIALMSLLDSSTRKILAKSIPI